MALCMSTRKPPKKVVASVDVVLVIEARAPFIREDIRHQVESRLGWVLVGEADGPSLRLTYKVPITGE